MINIQPVLTALIETIGLCIVVALILERALAVLFKDPGFAQSLLKMPQTIPFFFGEKFANFPKLPLRDGVTLFIAIVICSSIPLHLLSNIKAHWVSDDIDSTITALFITGSCQVVQSLFARLGTLLSFEPMSKCDRKMVLGDAGKW